MNCPLYGPGHGTLVEKANLCLRRMYIHVHRFGVDVDPDQHDRVATYHQKRVIALLDDEVERPMLDQASIDEDMHLLAMRTGYRGSGDPARDLYALHPCGGVQG